MSATDRNRPHPEDRFAAATQVLDLNAVAAEIAAESTAPHGGHRQKSLYRLGPTSLSLFVFQPGGELREHRTNGTVFIQVVRGRLSVHAGGHAHELGAGQVLVLSPGVPHDLRAAEFTHMLLTVSLQTPPG